MKSNDVIEELWTKMLAEIPDAPPDYVPAKHGVLINDIVKAKRCDAMTARRKADRLCETGKWERIQVRVGKANAYAYRPKGKAR